MQTSIMQVPKLFALEILKKGKQQIFFVGWLMLLVATQISCATKSNAVIPEQTKPVQNQIVGVERVLKKKIVMTGFAVNIPAQVQDIDDIAQGLPREILSRLEHSGSFLVRQSPNLLSYDLKQPAPPAKLVQQVAAENDAQFVIAGEIRNAGVRVEKKYFGLWENRNRHIEIEFSIYDGMSGAFLSRHHLYRPAEDDSKIGRDKPFGSVVFYATHLGKAIDSIVDESVAWIRKDLAPFPLIAKIIKRTDKQIVLDAGLSSNLEVGDQALLVADFDHLPVLGLSAQQAKPLQYGIPQASLGKMVITQVQLPFAVAEIQATAENDIAPLKVGDFVRFDVGRY